MAAVSKYQISIRLDPTNLSLSANEPSNNDSEKVLPFFQNHSYNIARYISLLGCEEIIFSAEKCNFNSNYIDTFLKSLGDFLEMNNKLKIVKQQPLDHFLFPQQKEKRMKEVQAELALAREGLQKVSEETGISCAYGLQQ